MLGKTLAQDHVIVQFNDLSYVKKESATGHTRSQLIKLFVHRVGISAVIHNRYYQPSAIPLHLWSDTLDTAGTSEETCNDSEDNYNDSEETSEKISCKSSDSEKNSCDCGDDSCERGEPWCWIYASQCLIPLIRWRSCRIVRKNLASARRTERGVTFQKLNERLRGYHLSLASENKVWYSNQIHKIFMQILLALPEVNTTNSYVQMVKDNGFKFTLLTDEQLNFDLDDIESDENFTTERHEYALAGLNARNKWSSRYNIFYRMQRCYFII